MQDTKIEEIAAIARNEISKIPFAKEAHISVKTYDYGVYYEARSDGFFEVSEERGQKRETKAASTKEEMVDYFVEEAIRKYADNYELSHRRKFESNLRQRDEIMQECYKYINPSRKFVKESYDDTIHIYFDLFDYYKETAKQYLNNYGLKAEKEDIKEPLEFIANGMYAASSGGMSDVNMAMSLVRYQINKIKVHNKYLKEKFEKYEDKYTNLILDVDIFPHHSELRIGGRSIKLPEEIRKYKMYRNFIYFKTNQDIIIDRYSNIYVLKTDCIDEEEIDKKYQLGKYDNVLEPCEELLQNIRCHNKVVLNSITDERLRRYLCMRSLFNVHTGRNLKEDIDIFFKIIKVYGSMGYEGEIYDVFVRNLYGVFPFGDSIIKTNSIKTLKSIGIVN